MEKRPVISCNSSVFFKFGLLTRSVYCVFGRRQVLHRLHLHKLKWSFNKLAIVSNDALVAGDESKLINLFMHVVVVDEISKIDLVMPAFSVERKLCILAPYACCSNAPAERLIATVFAAAQEVGNRTIKLKFFCCV